MELALNPSRNPDELLFWGKTVGVTGNGPYEEEAVKRIVRLEGAMVGGTDAWQINQMIVVGRKTFDKGFLNESARISSECKLRFRYLSQEDFWDYWLKDRETVYYRGDPRIANHEGLNYLTEIGFPWPSTESVSGPGGTGELADRLNPDHVLKTRFGYNVNVREGLSTRERHLRLSRAVEAPNGLGLLIVVSHVAGLVRRHGLRRDASMLDALDKWKSDLCWLYRTYYVGTKHSFIWPEY